MDEPREIILIIDDTEENRYSLGRYLRQQGFEVWEASTGKIGLELAGKNPSLITLDINLPDISGFDLCRVLKSDPRTASIPILHTSATFTDSSDKIQGLEGGADGYLVQPVNPRELDANVRALLRVRRAEATARTLANQWQVTFDAMADGVCLLDEKGQVSRSNRAFDDCLGVTAARSQGRPFTALLASAGVSNDDLATAIRDRAAATSFVSIGTRHLQVSLNLVMDEGVECGLTCVFSDVTSARRAEELLQRVNDELETRVRERTAELHDANLQMETFCYSVAHDLRTPLRAMHQFAQLLLEDEAERLSEDGRTAATRIHSASQRMDTLIQDLLLYSRVSRDKLELRETPLLDLVQEIIRDHTGDGEAPGLITVSIPAELTVRAHLPTFRQAIWNLLINALKFVAPGVTPRVDIYTEEIGSKVRLFLKDNGIGIAPEYHEKIFKVFEQLHRQQYAGTGIGLAIVRRAMDRMGGAVGFTSAPGEGSTFWLELPKA